MKIEIDAIDISFVDKRAIYLAAKFIAKNNDGKISFDRENWISVEEFNEIAQPYINSSFADAVEISLSE